MAENYNYELLCKVCPILYSLWCHLLNNNVLPLPENFVICTKRLHAAVNILLFYHKEQLDLQTIQTVWNQIFRTKKILWNVKKTNTLERFSLSQEINRIEKTKLQTSKTNMSIPWNSHTKQTALHFRVQYASDKVGTIYSHCNSL